MASQLTKGDLFERRVARLLFAEGSFVRRRVDLQAAYGERAQITDLDVFSCRFTPALGFELASGECKTTEARSAPTALDLLLRNVGVARLVGARSALLATHRTLAPRTRALGRQLGAEMLDLDDMTRREWIVGIHSEGGYGSHHPAFGQREKDAAVVAKREPELHRIFVFSRSELWLGDPYIVVKRVIQGFRTLGRSWSERLPEVERGAIEWMVAECLVGAAVALARIAGAAYRQSEEAFAAEAQRRLAEGVASYEALERVSREVDRYVMALLVDAGVDPARQVNSLGAFMPRPPKYADSLIEVIQRFSASPVAAGDSARVADWHFARSRLAQSAEGFTPRFVDEAESLRLLRLLATFFVSHTSVPATILNPLLEKARETENGGAVVAGETIDADTRQSLPEGNERLFDAEAAESRPKQ